MSSSRADLAANRQLTRWRAVWVRGPWLDERVDVSGEVHAAARSIGIRAARVDVRQRHVIVEYELHATRDGETAGHILKTESEARLVARLGFRPGGWWGQGLFVTRL